MFSKFLKRKTAPVRTPENPTVPPGVVVWAIGDIHGRLDLLRPLVEAVLADAAASAAARKVVVFLGDYIDRGPDSRGVIRYLCNLQKDCGVEWRFLKGNHEETMLDFLEDPGVGSQWCEYGGVETLASYGLKPPSLKHRIDAWTHISADLDHKLSKAERTFLEELELALTIGDYFFCHAGARPGVDLADQSAEDLLWIRRTFLESDDHFDRIIVHGHTPTSAVHADHRRLCVDTMAYASGILTAVRLENRDRSLLSTRCEGGTIFVSREPLRDLSVAC